MPILSPLMPSGLARLLAATAVTLCISLAAAACGGDDNGATATTTTATGGGSATTTSAAGTTGVVDRAHLCTIIGPTEFSELVGVELTQTNAPTDSTSCEYYTDDGADLLQAQAAVEATFEGGKQLFDEYGFVEGKDDPISGGTFQAVSGVGDAGFVAVSEENGFLYALRGDVFLTVFVGNGVSTSEDALKTIGNLFFERVGA